MNKKSIKIISGFIVPVGIVTSYWGAKNQEHIDVNDFSHQDLRTQLTYDQGSSIMSISATTGTPGVIGLLK